MKTETTVEISMFLTSLILAQLVIITVIFGGIMMKDTSETKFVSTPIPLNPREHEISRVEDLFIPFSYKNNSTFSFTMTENFTAFNIVLQPNREGENTSYEHTVEIDSATIIGTTTYVYGGIEQVTTEFEGFVYGGTYTLYFDGGRGVATAT